MSMATQAQLVGSIAGLAWLGFYALLILLLVGARWRRVGLTAAATFTVTLLWYAVTPATHRVVEFWQGTPLVLFLTWGIGAIVRAAYRTVRRGIRSRSAPASEAVDGGRT